MVLSTFHHSTPLPISKSSLVLSSSMIRLILQLLQMNDRLAFSQTPFHTTASLINLFLHHIRLLLIPSCICYKPTSFSPLPYLHCCSQASFSQYFKPLASIPDFHFTIFSHSSSLSAIRTKYDQFSYNSNNIHMFKNTFNALTLFCWLGI